jgi:hypothetical protein
MPDNKMACEKTSSLGNWSSFFENNKKSNKSSSENSSNLFIFLIDNKITKNYNADMVELINN